MGAYGRIIRKMGERTSPNSNVNPNRARDHLANERTYLAWIRTAVAFLGIGIVIVRLRYLLPAQVQTHHHGWALGLVFGVAGLIMVLLATSHYFYVQRAIENNSYQPESRWIIVCSIVVTLVGTGVIYYLLTSPDPTPVVPESSAAGSRGIE